CCTVLCTLLHSIALCCTVLQSPKNRKPLVLQAQTSKSGQPLSKRAAGCNSVQFIGASGGLFAVCRRQTGGLRRPLRKAISGRLAEVMTPSSHRFQIADFRSEKEPRVQAEWLTPDPMTLVLPVNIDGVRSPICSFEWTRRYTLSGGWGQNPA